MSIEAGAPRQGERGLALSVVLCTFNGERFLREQLDSIAAQTRRPDELIVCDDASLDRTRDVLDAFVRTAPFASRISFNRQRVGSTANFESAIARAEGDVIVLSDQDDVWRPDRLARIAAAFTPAPAVACVFSDAEVVGENLQPLGYRLWRSVHVDRRQQRRIAKGETFDVLLRQNVATGATMAFRADLRDLLLPIPTGWVHDGWIALLAAAVGTCVPIAEPLVRYRQHAGQQIGGRRRTFFQQVAIARRMDAGFFEKLAADYELARERLAASRRHRCPETVLAKLDAKIAHCRRRAGIRNRRSLAAILSELVSGGYHRYSMGWKAVASDVFL